MKFIHPDSKMVIKKQARNDRLTKLKQQKLNHKTAKRHELLDMLRFYQGLLKDKNTYSDSEITQITVKYFISEYSKQPKSNTKQVLLEITLKNNIQLCKAGCFRIPDLKNEENVLNLKLWDGALESSQRIKLVPIEISNLDQQLGMK